MLIVQLGQQFVQSHMILHISYRWKIELCLRDLKTTMGMEELRCKSPSMARKELLTYLIAHNLMRGIMLNAAVRHDAAVKVLRSTADVTTLDGAFANAKFFKEI